MFVYCGLKKNWYWSADRVHWQTVRVHIATGGRYRGKRPRNEDVKIMEKLMSMEVENSPSISGKTCTLCKLQ